MKQAIIITSDPKNGDESLGRAFNAMALAAESLAAGDEVEIVFVGAATRWPAELTKVDSPLNGLYNAVRPAVIGASCGCGHAFGATEDVQSSGLPEIKEFNLEGAPAPLASIRKYVADGWHTLVF